MIRLVKSRSILHPRPEEPPSLEDVRGDCAESSRASINTGDSDGRSGVTDLRAGVASIHARPAKRKKLSLRRLPVGIAF